MNSNRLSKSAPAGIMDESGGRGTTTGGCLGDGKEGNSRRRWMSTGVSTLKEIESWARQGQSASLDLSRHSGQLAENVTEERMLYGKLMELSKERYKFLSQNQYERKSFLDRQRQKSAALRNVLLDVGVDGQRTPWATSSASRENASTSQSDRRKSMSVMSRNNTLTTISESQLRTESKSAQPPSTSNPEQEDRLDYFFKTPASRSKSVTGYRKDKLFPTETASLDGTNSVFSAPENHKLPDLTQGAESRKTPGVRFANQDTVHKGSVATEPGGRASSARSAKSHVSTSTDGRRRGPPTNDRRYLRLASALCENYDLSKERVDVNDVIRALDSLHVPPKRLYTVYKPKTSIFLQRFLRERGIAI